MNEEKFVVPILPHSAPLPASLITLYIMLTIAGIMIFKTLTGSSMEEFLGPARASFDDLGRGAESKSFLLGLPLKTPGCGAY